MMLFLAALLASSALGQAPAAPAATLRVTVVDPSNAIIVGAKVTVSGAEDNHQTATIAPAQTAENGVATIAGLTPGRYTIQAEFPDSTRELSKMCACAAARTSRSPC